MEGPRWQREQALVIAAYPSAQAHAEVGAGAGKKFWIVRMSPVTSSDRLPYALADLDANRSVCLRLNGEVGHAAECPALAGEHAQYPLVLRPTTYVVRLDYPEHEYDRAGPVHPQARVLEPAVTIQTMPQHPHLFTTLDRSDSWACPIAPHQAHWTWHEGGTVMYLDQVAIWLLKTIVWWRTGGGVLRFGRWLGDDASHDPLVLLGTDARSPCPCGSGKKYGNCHRQSHLEAVLRGLGMRLPCRTDAPSRSWIRR